MTVQINCPSQLSSYRLFALIRSNSNIHCNISWFPAPNLYLKRIHQYGFIFKVTVNRCFAKLEAKKIPIFNTRVFWLSLRLMLLNSPTVSGMINYAGIFSFNRQIAPRSFSRRKFLKGLHIGCLTNEFHYLRRTIFQIILNLFDCIRYSVVAPR